MRLTKHQREIIGLFEAAGFKVTLEQRKKHTFVWVEGEHVISLHQGDKVTRRHYLTARSTVNRLLRGRENAYRRSSGNC